MIRGKIVAMLFLIAGLYGCDEFKTIHLFDAAKAPGKRGVITADAVWKGNANGCQTALKKNECLMDAVVNNGTRDAALAVYYITSKDEAGYVSGFIQTGKIAIATITFPFRKTDASQEWIVPVSGTPVETDEILENLENYAPWKRYASSFPDLSPVSPGVRISIEEKNTGTDLYYGYPIRSCRECLMRGMLIVKYRFNTDGEFINQEISNIIS